MASLAMSQHILQYLLTELLAVSVTNLLPGAFFMLSLPNIQEPLWHCSTWVRDCQLYAVHFIQLTLSLYPIYTRACFVFKQIFVRFFYSKFIILILFSVPTAIIFTYKNNSILPNASFLHSFYPVVLLG